MIIFFTIVFIFSRHVGSTSFICKSGGNCFLSAGMDLREVQKKKKILRAFFFFFFFCTEIFLTWFLLS